MRILRYIAPYIIQAVCLIPLVVYMSRIRPPLKEEILVGLFIIGYFASCAVVLLPVTAWHMVGVWKARINCTARLFILVVALCNLGISIWMPRLVWKVVGFETKGTAQQIGAR